MSEPKKDEHYYSIRLREAVKDGFWTVAEVREKVLAGAGDPSPAMLRWLDRKEAMA